MLLRIHSRAASILANNEDVGLLTGPGPHTARHHVKCRLLNIEIIREKMRLELEQVEQEEMTSGRTKFYFNPTAKPFILRGIKAHTKVSREERDKKENI